MKRKAGIALLMVMCMLVLVACPKTPTGKIDRVEAVVASYELSAVSFITVKAALSAMETSKYWSPEGVIKAKAQFAVARGNDYQAGEYIKLWIQNPQTAPISQFPVLMTQVATVLGTILGGNFVASKADEKVKVKFIPQSGFKASDSKLGIVITPEMISLAINAILVTANFVSNYVGEVTEVSQEAKDAFIKRIQAAQSTLPVWE